MTIGLVIINFNGKKDTLECLESIEILSLFNKYKIEIFLIDNHSLDPLTIKEIKSFNLKITFIVSEKNEGFAEGNNIGIRKALENSCNYIVLLNNDTIIVDNSIYRLIDELEKNSAIGIGGIVNYYFNNPTEIWHAGLINDFKFGKTKSIVKFDRNLNVMNIVDYVPGSSIVIKKDVFNKIGLLDTRYFAYFEENDFCQRAKKEGFYVGFLQNSKILHKVGKSSSNNVKIYLRTRNILLFYTTHASSKYVLIILIRHVLITLISIFKSPSNIIASIRALFLGIHDFNKKIFYEGSISKL